MVDVRPARALLDFLDEILREHNASPAGVTRVLPCIVADIEANLDAVIATVRTVGGVVLNATRTVSSSGNAADRIDYHDPVPGRMPSAMTSALQAALQYERAGVPVAIAVTDTPYGLDASYTAASTTPFGLAGAKDPLLALVRALASERLEKLRDGLAVVVYNEADLDPEQRDVVATLGRQLSGLRLGPRTLVLIAASGDISAPRHLQHDSGFRLALQPDEVLRRHSPAARDDAIATILGGNPPFTALFLGAGFSYSSGLSLGNSLRDRALQPRALSPSGAPPERLAADWYALVEEQGRLLESERLQTPEERVNSLTLERVLREEYRAFAPALPETLRRFQEDCARALSTIGEAPRALADLLATGRRVILSTVNFDQLVETACGKLCRPFIYDRQFEEAVDYIAEYLNGDHEAAPLLKLHGSIEDLTTCIASDDRTLRGLPLAKQRALEELLRQAEVRGTAPWIYVGASMRDTDLNPFWGRTDFATQMREYWVSPYAVRSMRDFANAFRTERWAEQRAMGFEQRLITETADSFLRALADAARASRP